MDAEEVVLVEVEEAAGEFCKLPCGDRGAGN